MVQVRAKQKLQLLKWEDGWMGNHQVLTFNRMALAVEESAAANGIKLFNKWSFDDVEIKDLALIVCLKPCLLDRIIFKSETQFTCHTPQAVTKSSVFVKLK
jgi:hypothetical protein